MWRSPGWWVPFSRAGGSGLCCGVGLGWNFPAEPSHHFLSSQLRFVSLLRFAFDPDHFLELGPENINQGGFLSGVRPINDAIIVFFPLSFYSCGLVLSQRLWL